MTEPENFITRWSRRKAAETDAETERRVTPTETPAAEPDVGDEKRDEKRSAAPPVPAQNETEPPAIDLATLPPIESIGVGTDISVFLRAGVPAELTRAALRRAWSTDPAIRDFIGLAENAWDFTAPDGVPGFGPLSAADASRLMAEFTGKAKQAVKEVVEEAVERINARELPTAPESERAAPSPGDSVPPPTNANDADNERTRPDRDRSAQKSPAIIDESRSDGSRYVQRDKENNATQHNLVESADNAHAIRRAHGSALPE
jgi:hypothetical protein